jgi:hypothetical protein
MKQADIDRLDAIKGGAPCRVAYVRKGLTVAIISGTLEKRKTGGAWRVNSYLRSCTGFITPDDKVIIFKGNHFRVDLP